MSETCRYTPVSWTQKKLPTHAMGHLCAHAGTRELVYFLAYIQKPTSTPQTKQHLLKSHLVSFLLSSLLQAISSPHCPHQDPLGPAQLFGLDQGHNLLCPLNAPATTGWWGAERYLNDFMPNLEDSTSNCFTVACKGTQTNMDSYCFCSWNRRWKYWLLAYWHSHRVQGTWLLVEVFDGTGEKNACINLYLSINTHKRYR